MATYTYTKIADAILGQLFGYQSHNLLKNSLRYIAEDVLGDPSTDSDTINPKIKFLPTGTKMVFFQASPPTGWTIDATQNDKVLRVVSSGGGGSGGAAATSAGLGPGSLQFQTGEISNNSSEFVFMYNAAGAAQYTHSVQNQSAGAGSGTYYHTTGAATQNADFYTKGGTGVTAVPAYIDVVVGTKD